MLNITVPPSPVLLSKEHIGNSDGLDSRVGGSCCTPCSGDRVILGHTVLTDHLLSLAAASLLSIRVPLCFLPRFSITLSWVG